MITCDVHPFFSVCENVKTLEDEEQVFSKSHGAPKF